MPSLGKFLQGQVVSAAGVPSRLRPSPGGPVLEGAAMQRNDVTYSASMTPDLALGNWIVITATNGVAFTVNNPVVNGAVLSAANVPVGLLIVLTFVNTSGGNLGAITLGTVYKGNSGFTATMATGLSQSAAMLTFSATQFLGVGSWSGPFAV